METNTDRQIGHGEARLTCGMRMIALDAERRRVTHVISTARLDRANRVVEPAGWQLANFRANPIVLADHDYAIEKVIGGAHDTKLQGEELISTTEFADTGLGALAFAHVQAGLLRAWSVGWRGIARHKFGEVEGCERCAQHKRVEWGVHFTRQELLEYSLVAVPANPDVVMGLEAAGVAVDDSAIEEWNAMTAAGPEPVRPAPDGANAAPIRSAQFYRQLFELGRGVKFRSVARQMASRR